MWYCLRCLLAPTTFAEKHQVTVRKIYLSTPPDPQPPSRIIPLLTWFVACLLPVFFVLIAVCRNRLGKSESVEVLREVAAALRNVSLSEHR